MSISSINNFSEINIQRQKDVSITGEKINSLNKSEDDERLLEACREFEGIFIHMMLKEMKKTVPDGGLIEKSQGTEIFEEMHLEELSKEISRDDGIGIAKMMYEQFKSGRNNL